MLPTEAGSIILKICDWKSEFEHKNMKSLAQRNKWIGPISSNFGYHLIKLNEIKSGRPHPLERVKDKIELLIMEEKKKTVLSEEIDRLYKNYEVVLPLEEV